MESLPLDDEISSSRNEVKPMLTTSQKNFKQVTHPHTVLTGGGHPDLVREDLEVPGSRCFLLHGLLTPAECEHYITETEKIGYSDLSDLFPSDYRSNDRVLSICEPLVEELWRRIEPSLTRKEVVRVRPIGFGNGGTWKPFRLNECCKFGKYKAGGHFSPHIDGPWVPREDESSVFTVVIYLNSDFQGGATKFLSEENQDTVVCSVTPRTGTALIFNHDTLHEGEPVAMGTKYIIRTEIMYRRIDTEMLPNPGAYERDGNYIKTLTLYQKSWELEKAGDIQGFTDMYLEAIHLQRQAQRSISIESSCPDMALPYEIYLKIFSYLSVKDLCRAMRVCKVWYDLCLDGQVWYEMYRSKWPVGMELEGRIDFDSESLKIHDDQPFLRDWYGLYKQRVAMVQPQKVVVLDMGSFSFKCAAIHRQRSTIRTASCESVIAMVPGVFDLHMRRYTYQRYYSGKEAKETFPGETINVVKKGVVNRTPLLPEIVTRLFLDCVVRPKYSPVVVLERPGLWDDQLKREISYSFIMRFENPCVCFMSSAVATLCSVQVSTGVVVDVGHGVVTCAAVVDGDQRDYVHCDPSETTPTKLADMVHSVVTSSCSEDSDVNELSLMQQVVLTGGGAVDTELLQSNLRKKDSRYSVRKTDDPIYSAVKGGCSLAGLTEFDQVFKRFIFVSNRSSFPIHPIDFFKSKRTSVVGIERYFYTKYLSWFDYLNAGKKDYKKDFGIRWAVEKGDEDYDFLREWHKNSIEEEILVSSSGSSESEDTDSDN